MGKVLKKDFLKVVEKYPPNKFVRWYFDNFSKERSKEKVNNILVAVLISLFAWGLIATILQLDRDLIKYPTYAYVIILAIHVVLGFTAGKLNNRRIAKIRKELGLSIEEYERLANKYL